MTTTEILQAARDKIAKPEDWCQGNFAIDNDGNVTDDCGGGAAAWCARGALHDIVGWGVRGATSSGFLTDASWALFDKSVTTVNDSMSHKDVMRMYDLAIQESKRADL